MMRTATAKLALNRAEHKIKLDQAISNVAVVLSVIDGQLNDKKKTK